ncbi:MAG: 4-hydroxy-tetrahydrodipicolinate reductase [Coriobacteriia bacterium]|nr:4-hydroxy-tetrahydrodipicolinate reductase [Coriobacteriia bacterium]
MIKVLFNGYMGRMGQTIAPGLDAVSDIAVIAVSDPMSKAEVWPLPNGGEAKAFNSLEAALAACQPDVMVDFTQPTALEASLRIALPAGIDCVVGTTGVAQEKMEELAKLAPQGTCLFYAPNFAIGAVLMMLFARQAAPYFSDVEVIEFHHNGKLDAPSGTAMTTARQMAAVRYAAGVESTSPGRESELEGFAGARGTDVDGIPVHAVRGAGFVASQEVILASAGETLSIRHDNTDRAAYLPGILLAVRKVGGLNGLVVGLESLL